MNEDDEKLQAIIHNAKLLDLNINEISVLYCIHKAGMITQRDIERRADLRQPEVSLAIKHLASMGLLECGNQESLNKGRPVNVYTLKKPVSDYFLAIKKQKENELMMMRLALEDLGKQFSD
jgi:predicted transcriptional regulator